MKNEEIRDLCLALMRADTEVEVIGLLRQAGFWDAPDAWRFFGDYENNYNTIGNQQSRSDAALVEKLVNSVDARLMNECLIRNIDPEGSKAPTNVREAVSAFFEEPRRVQSDMAGRISHWSDSKRTDVARGITLSATGFPPAQGKPCFTIADCGEGQTPERMPETLLSLNRSNKLRIPFVQGKFNMGGTGVLKFCGHHHLQLIEVFLKLYAHLSRGQKRLLKGIGAWHSDQALRVCSLRLQQQPYLDEERIALQDRPPVGRSGVANSLPRVPAGVSR